MIVRTAVAATSLNGLGASSRFSGFSDALGSALAELESGLVEPDQLSGDLALLYASYRAELEKLGLWDRDLRRRHAAGPRRRRARRLGRPTRLRVRIRGPHRRAVGAARSARRPHRGHGLAAVRAEPGAVRVADAHVRGSELARARGASRSLLRATARSRRRSSRTSSGTSSPTGLQLRPSSRGDPLPRGRGARGTLELVADEVLQLIRAGTKPEEILLVCPSVERQRAQLETALTALDVPYAIEGRIRIGKTAFGQALLSFLRFEWLAGGRHDLYGFLRSPFSGLTRAHVDYLEGRLRGQAVSEPARVVEETLKLRGQPLRMLDAFRDGARAAGGGSRARPLDGPRRVRARGAAGRPGRRPRPAGSPSRQRPPRRAAGLDELGGALSREELYGALDRATLRLARGDEPGRVAVTDLLRARTRRTEVVFLLGLEEGSFPRRQQGSPFLADEERRSIDEASRRARLTRPDAVSRERYFFYTACTRPSRRLYLVREAATDDGSSARGEPVLGRGSRALRPGRRRSLDEAPRRWRSSRGGSRPLRPSASASAR